jgi:hypothetical protein
MATYTIKTDAEMYDIEAKNDEDAIEIAREDIQLTPELIAQGAWLRVFAPDGYPFYYEGGEVA